MPPRSDGIAELLGRWFDASARDLPWRRRRDPYAVWVSETMLQQTRVDTVVPYFERFMRDFPNVEALARAELDEVLLRWQGLGYYRRARQLHLAAAEVVDRYGGELPADPAELRRLSGVGPYTAGAIASIAFDRPAPIVDGNVTRVLSRLFALRGDPTRGAGKARIWALAAELVPAKNAGRFNEALMELGATVCTPSAPRCGACPVARRCRALAKGLCDILPELPARATPKPQKLVAVVLEAGRSVLFGKRPEQGLYAGLWEPPMLATLRAARGLGAAAGVKLERLGSVRHVLSHLRLEVAVVGASCLRRPLENVETYQRLAWSRPERVALSTLARKVLAVANP